MHFPALVRERSAATSKRVVEVEQSAKSADTVFQLVQRNTKDDVGRSGGRHWRISCVSEFHAMVVHLIRVVYLRLAL